MRYCLLLIFFGLMLPVARAQYAPQVGIAGSTAISASSDVFVEWASGCMVKRGYVCIDTPALGQTTNGDSSMAIGASDGFVVSLGDSGVADLTFAQPIYDGPGADFAVFENGFANPSNDSQAYLELAFVEVSSDGVNYFRFPATSLTQDTTQILGAALVGAYLYANDINNLAGKYVGGYGTPFDLQEMAGTPGLDINNVTHVRVVDVIGTIGNAHATFDNAGHKINDPYPTDFYTGGFDLDAVGVINQATSGVAVSSAAKVQVYPNPATDWVAINTGAKEATAVFSDAMGKILFARKLTGNGVNKLSLRGLTPGMYLLTIQDGKGNKWVEKINKL